MLFSDPRNATPIGVRAVETITASFIEPPAPLSQ
jgi:hypothetical protein